MNDVPVLEGFGCRLRPVTVADAAFIIRVRNQPKAIGKLHATSTSLADQEAWIRRYLARAGDYYWVIESVRTGEPVGVIGLYDVTPDGREAMPGRWTMLPQEDVDGMAPILLTYGFAFETLGVTRLVISVVPDNRRIIRFHQMCGATAIAVPVRYALEETASGLQQNWFELTPDAWRRMKAEWEPMLLVRGFPFPDPHV